MADAERQDQPLVVPEIEVIDLEAIADHVAPEPEEVYLEASGLRVRKDQVEETIRGKYRRILLVLGNNALQGTALKRKLQDYAVAASKATSGILIDRHTHLWGPIIRKARAEAKKELMKMENMMDMAERQEDINSVAPVEKRANHRYNKACEGCDRAVALIRDLTRFLEAGS